MTGRAKKADSALGAEMVRDMEGLVATLAAGGESAVRKKFTTRRVKVVAPPALTPADVKKARAGIGASQAVFAQYIGVSVKTVRAWEQGDREPVTAARRLIADIRDTPEHWKARLAEAVAGG